MANAERGEVEFEADGKQWILRYSANSLCELETLLDLSTGEILGRLQDPAGARVTLLRAVLWAGLRDHHREIDLPAAGEMISAMGLQSAVASISEAANKAFPLGKEDAEGPQKGEVAGTGKSS